LMGSLLIRLAILSLAMIPLESRWPGVPSQRRFRRGWLLALVYWFFTTLIAKPVSKFVVAIILLPALKFSGAGTFEKLLEGFGPLGRRPRLDQALQMIVLIDFMGYWLHRWFHGRRMWRFHAIHHSSVDLDWLSAARVYPVNDIVNKATAAGLVVSLGYSPLLIARVLPFFVAYAILQHANVTWDFGPLKKVFAGPKFHRWHHTSAQAGPGQELRRAPAAVGYSFPDSLYSGKTAEPFRRSRRRA